MDDKGKEKIPIDIDSLENQLEKKKDELPEKSEETDYAFSWKYSESENNSKSRRKNRPNGSVLLHTLMISAVFAVAFAATCAIFVATARSTQAASVNEPQSESTSTAAQPEKTVFIKEHNAKNGALTPEEIYEKCSPSAVSILAKSDGSEGIGSGFVYSSEGYIVTAHHVVDRMDKISVILKSGEEYAATLVASNELCDLALLKISAEGLVPVELGESSKLLVGEEVMAIGTPASLEFAGTMTRGDVSFNDREISIFDDQDGSLKKKMTLIQTSAPLNPGNSGGPVFDVHGRLVGIVTMRLSDGFDGIGFAIPAERAMPIISDMKNGIEPADSKLSAVARYSARLGIIGQDHSIEYNGNSVAGVKIAEFSSPECDAAKKLRAGDVIVSVENDAISNTASLLKKISEYSVGDTVNVTVMRNAQLLTFSILLIK